MQPQWHKGKKKKSLRREAFQPCREARLMGGPGQTKGVLSQWHQGFILTANAHCIMIARATHISSNGFSFLVACMATLSQHAKVGNKVDIRGTRHVLNLVMGQFIAQEGTFVSHIQFVLTAMLEFEASWCMLLAIPAVPNRVCLFGCRITLIEAAQLLGTFDEPLRKYAEEKLNKQGVHLKKVCHGILLLVVSLLALTL